MNYSSFNIQGNIISSEILDKIRTEEIKFQSPADFGLDKKTSVREEINIAWNAIRAHYTAFRLRADRLKEGDSGTSETRNSWMLPFLRELGYDLQSVPAYIHPDTGKSYAISHQANNRKGFPVHIMGIHDDLDKRRDGSGPRLSPHALAQEYLNNTEHTYALVTNGRYLRLLRDATRLVRLSYLEIDLIKMVEEDLYNDFAVLFRLLHATRMPALAEALEESFIEYYHQESLASGSRIRERLSRAVENSIKTLANGFLKHPENTQLREDIQKGITTPAAFYQLQLRLIYRFLFLLVTEERNLVYPHTQDPAVQRLRNIYYEFYSLERLRKLAAQAMFVEGRKQDLWEGIKATFLLFEKEVYGSRIGLQALGSGIFRMGELGILDVLKLDNASLIQVVRWLTQFEDDNKQWRQVNYMDLDIEEFGSVYEGLLEYDAAIKEIEGMPVFTFVEGKDRSSSGSHYTPEELVKPLIKHSLDYVIEDKLKEKNPEQALLSIKVCDPACGSGHILLSAARRIALELARLRTREDQPSPSAVLKATRDVIKHCIYGVDKNPLAVELCKVVFWLEAHNPGEPLNFLDHHIKCGDAIVGLARVEELERGIPSEAFKTLPGDDKATASLLKKSNETQRKARLEKKLYTIESMKTVEENYQTIFSELKQWQALEETKPEDTERKAKAYFSLVHSSRWNRLKTLADIQTAQFLIPKLDVKKCITDDTYFEYLRGNKAIQEQNTALASSVASEQDIFNWFIEFPDVFAQGGFDCILGNPPFLGGQKLSGTFGNHYLEFLKYQYAPAGAVDLVTYFFRRTYELIKERGFISLISTNTIAQGNAREAGLDVLKNKGASINHAVRSMKWPGIAAVEVALVTVHKGEWKQNYVLGNKEVKTITPYLHDAETLNNPFRLIENESKSFIGSYVLGLGFVLEPKEAEKIINSDPRNKEVVFPYLNGSDLNSNSNEKAERWVINFDERTLEEASSYELPFEIVKSKVYPERILKDVKKYPRMVNEWWKFWMNRQGLNDAIRNNDKVLAIARVSKTVAFTIVDAKQVFDDKIVVFSNSSFEHFCVIQSNIHTVWAWQYCTTLKADLSYTPSTIYETFPFFRLTETFDVNTLKEIGSQYFVHRTRILTLLALGLTKIYNLFHEKDLSPLAIILTRQGKLGEKTYREYLEQEKVAGGVVKPSMVEEAEKGVQLILELRKLHVQMDQAVLEAYGWQDIALRHDFYEVDYLPENDRVRYTIHPEARKEVLKRLLELNHKIHAEEVKAKEEAKLKEAEEKAKGKGKKKKGGEGTGEIGF